MTQMAQDPQHLKTEIRSSLDSLSLDSLQVLSRFIAFLRSTADQPKYGEANGSVELNDPKQRIRITSPRLVHRYQIADFKKEIVE